MEKIKISSRASSMQASPIRKLHDFAVAAKKKGKKVHHVNIGQPDIPTPKPFMDEVRNFKEKVVEYAPSQGILECQEAYVKYYKKKGINLTVDDVVVTTGGSEALIFAISTVTDPGDEIIVFEPFYTNYNGFATLVGSTLVPLKTTVEEGFRLPSKEDIEAKITDQTKAIIVCNPNNPTGTVYDEQELDVLVDLAKEHNLFLIGDEVYSDFSYEKPHKSLLEYTEISDRVIVIDSISKKFSCCGGRVGAIISRNKDVMTAALRYGQARLSTATIEQVAAAKVIGDADEYIKEAFDEYKKRRDTVYEELQKIEGAVFTKPEGAFYNIVKLPIDDSDKFAEWLLEHYDIDGETVMIAPAAGFYATPGLGKDEIRIAYVLNSDDMRKAIEILRKGIEEYNSKK